MFVLKWWKVGQTKSNEDAKYYEIFLACDYTGLDRIALSLSVLHAKVTYYWLPLPTTKYTECVEIFVFTREIAFKVPMNCITNSYSLNFILIQEGSKLSAVLNIFLIQTNIIKRILNKCNIEYWDNFFLMITHFFLEHWN